MIRGQMFDRAERRPKSRGPRDAYPRALVRGADDEPHLGCARSLGRGDCGRPRASDVSRLRSELGRLRPRRIRRSAAQALRLGLQRPTRAVVGEPVLLRRWLRLACGARRQAAAVHAVRDPPLDWRGGGNCRTPGHVAHRPAHRRAARGAYGARAARRLSALLRPYVHEPEGFSLRGRNGDLPARRGARPGAISTRAAGDRKPRRHRLRPCVRLPHHGRIRTDRRARGRGLDRHGRGPRRRHPRGRRAARTFPPGAPALHGAGLRRDGADLAVVRGRSAQPIPRR